MKNGNKKLLVLSTTVLCLFFGVVSCSSKNDPSTSTSNNSELASESASSEAVSNESVPSEEASSEEASNESTPSEDESESEASTPSVEESESISEEVKVGKLTFVLNDGALPEGNYEAGDVEPTPTKNGYTFDGWYESSDLSGEKVSFPLTIGEEDVTLYAKYNVVNYSINYHLNGGSDNDANALEYNVETETITLLDASKEYQVFKGWYSDEDFTTQVTEVAKGTTGNLELYAKFENNLNLANSNYTKDGYSKFLEIKDGKIIFNDEELETSVEDWTFKAKTSDNKNIELTFNPSADQLSYLVSYYATENSETLTQEEGTLDKIVYQDTTAYAGTYYEGSETKVAYTTLDSIGHVITFNGASVVNGTYTVSEDGNLIISYKANQYSENYTNVTGTMEDGYFTINSDGKNSIFVKQDKAAALYNANLFYIYTFDSFTVVEENGNDYFATIEGSWAADEIVTLAYNNIEKVVKIEKVGSDTSWGKVVNQAAWAGTYNVDGSEDVIYLDGFDSAKFNNEAVSYDTIDNFDHVIITKDGVDKYYALDKDASTATEVTTKDGYEGKYVKYNETTSYVLSGYGFYKSGSSYYAYKVEDNTIKIGYYSYTLSHNNNVLSNANGIYVKEGYAVTEQDFTEYLSKTYTNTELNVQLMITATESGYSVTLSDDVLTISKGTYEATKILDELSASGFELVLSNGGLSLIVNGESYELSEVIQETFVEKVAGVYKNVNGSTITWIRLTLKDDTLTANYSSSTSTSYSLSNYAVSSIDEINKTFLVGSSSNATFNEEEGVCTLTFGSTGDYYLKGKTFTKFDDSSVTLVPTEGGVQINAGDATPSGSKCAAIYEDGVKMNSQSIGIDTMSADMRTQPGTYSVRVYSTVYGRLIEAYCDVIVNESFTLSSSNKSSYTTSETMTKEQVIGLGLFTAKHNGVADTITPDMITLPEDFNTTVSGAYTITCSYHGTEKTATLTINVNPYTYTFGSFKSSSAYLLLTSNGADGGTVIYATSFFTSSMPTGDQTGTFTISTSNVVSISIGGYTFEYKATVEGNVVTALTYSSSTYYSTPTYGSYQYDLKNNNFAGIDSATTNLAGKGTEANTVKVEAGKYTSTSSFANSTYWQMNVNGSSTSVSYGTLVVNTTLTADQLKNVGNVYKLDGQVYYAGQLYTAECYIEIVNNVTVSYKSYSSTIDATEGYDLTQLFEVKLNGEAVTVTNDMISFTTPSDMTVATFDSTVAGQYKVVCTYEGKTATTTLTITPSVIGTYASADNAHTLVISEGTSSGKLNVLYDGTTYSDKTMGYSSTYGCFYISTGYYDNPYLKVFVNAEGNIDRIEQSTYSSQSTLVATLTPSTGGDSGSGSEEGGDTGEVEQDSLCGYYSCTTKGNSYYKNNFDSGITITKNSNGTYNIYDGNDTTKLLGSNLTLVNGSNSVTLNNVDMSLNSWDSFKTITIYADNDYNQNYGAKFTKAS